MASIIIRGLEDSIKERLRARAAKHRRSMEEEAREILKSSLAGKMPAEPNLATSIRRRFADLGGIEVPEVPRDTMRRAPDLDK